MNIEGYNPSEATPKRTREERILNTTTTRQTQRTARDINNDRKEKVHWTNQHLKDHFEKLLLQMILKLVKI